MRRNIVALPADMTLEALDRSLRAGGPRRQQLLYPVIDPQSRLVGVVTRTDLQQLLDGRRPTAEGPPLSRLIQPEPTVAYPDEPLRAVVYRMAETGLTRFPVIEREGGKLVGIVALFDLLAARVRTLEAEHRRERVLPVRFFLPRGLGRARA
jgi:CBS domain-containing protein